MARLILVALVATILVLWGYFAIINITQPEPDELGKFTLGFIATLAGFFLTFIFGGSPKGRWLILLIQFIIIMFVIVMYAFVGFNQHVGGIIS